MAQNPEQLLYQSAAETSDQSAANAELQVVKREVVLLHLLSGQYFIDLEHILRDARNAGISFQHPYYLVVAARVEDWGTIYSRSMEETLDVHFILRNLMEHAVPDSYGVTYCGKVAFVVNTPDDMHSSLFPLKQQLLELTELLEREFQLIVSFTVSQVYDTPLALENAWNDTEDVFEYRDIIAEDFVVSTYEDLTYESLQVSPHDAYMELTSRLLACIRQADYEGIRLVFHAIIDNEFSTVHPSIHTFRFRIYGVVDQLLSLMDHLRSSVGHETMNQINPGPRLTRKQPLPQLIAEIDDILDGLIALTSKQTGTVYPSWLEQVHAYILENFRDSELYVSQVADHFHVSSTYCSKLFRERYGVRMFDYIQLRRLEAAKGMLNSGASMKEIAASSGFSSALTMSRAFKRYESSTPSTYKV